MQWTNERLAKQLPKNFGHQPFWRLRWRFDFVDRPTRRGVWNDGSGLLQDKAAYVDKSGLLRAYVEGEKVGAYYVKILAEVDGHEYAHCAWEAAAQMAPFYKKTYRTPGNIIGLSLFTADKKTTVYVDGQIKTTNLTQRQRKFDLTEHRAGV